MKRKMNAFCSCMRTMPVIMAVVAGATMNFVIASLCERMHKSERDTAITRTAMQNAQMVFTWSAATRPPTVLSEIDLPSVWPEPAPDGWPVAPEYVRSRRYNWLLETHAYAAWKHTEPDHFDLRSMIVTDSGWPFRSIWRANLAEWAFVPRAGNLPTNTRMRVLTVPRSLQPIAGLSDLPIGIRTGPFIGNTLAYSLVIWCGLLIPGTVRRIWRTKSRVCSRCGYPIGGSPVCTECGEPIPVRRLSLK